jgi:hypothetical protein
MGNKLKAKPKKGLTKKNNMSIIMLMALLQLGVAPSYAASTSGGLAELQAALAAAGVNDFTVNANITPIANLGALAGTSLAIYGANNYDLNGGGLYSGITVAAPKILSISNFGSLNGDGTVLTSIKNFKSTTGGSFINGNGPLTLSSNVLYNNTSVGSTVVASLTVSGGAVNETLSIATSDPAGVVVTGNKFFGNQVSSANTNAATAAIGNIYAYGGAIANMLTESGAGQSLVASTTGNTFGSATPAYGNSSSATNATTTTTFATTAMSYGGAIYNAVTASGANSNITLNINDSNSFTNNASTASASSTKTTGASTATAYGGAIYNAPSASGAGTGATVAVNINNLNTFTGNTATSTNTSPTTTGATYAYANGGAVANDFSLATTNSSSTTSIDSNTFKTNTASATNNAKPSAAGTTDATAQGGAVFNLVTLATNAVTVAGTTSTITNNTFGGVAGEKNTAIAVNSSLAPSGAVTANSSGGSIHKEINAIATRNSTTNTINVNTNTFKSSLSSATVQNNIAVVPGTTISTGAKTATANGGAVANKITLSGATVNSNVVTNIKGNAFGSDATNGNTAYSGNTTTTTTTGTTGVVSNGGAIYNYATLAGLNTAITNIGRTGGGDTATSDNTFYNNTASANNSSLISNTVAAGAPSATALGGAIYNYSTMAATTVNSTNTKYNTFVGNSAAATNSATSASTTSTTGIATATTSGGAIYNYTTILGTTAHSDFSAENSIFGGSNLADGNTVISTNSSWTKSGAKDALAYGGAIYSELASSTTAATTNNVNINYDIFKNNRASSSVENNASLVATTGIKTATSYGGAVYNKFALSGQNATGVVNIKGNTFGTGATDSNAATATNSDTTTTTAATAANAYGGAIYNYLTQATGSIVTLNIGRALDGDPASDDNIFTYNKAEAINSSITTTGATSATAYGGAIFNDESVLLTAISTTNIKYQSFTINSALATNSSSTTTGATGATANGGALYNVITSQSGGTNTINLNNDTFTSNAATATNSSTTANTTVAVAGAPSATALGGAIFNTATMSLTAAYSVNTDNSTYTSNAATALTSGTSTNSGGVSGATTATTSGGAIYNYATITAGTTAHSDFSAENSIFGGSNLADATSATHRAGNNRPRTFCIDGSQTGGGASAGNAADRFDPDGPRAQGSIDGGRRPLADNRGP